MKNPIISILTLTIVILPFLSSVNSSQEVPQITDKPRIVVYETYYLFFSGISRNDPFALDEEELRNRDFGFIKEGNVFFYLSNNRDIEVLIEYFPNLNEVRVYSRRFYLDRDEMTEGEILENFNGYIADLRKKAIMSFEDILVEGNQTYGVRRYRIPLKFLSIKDTQFQPLNKKEFGEMGAFEVKNEMGQLIAWDDMDDSEGYLSNVSRITYLISNYPETGTEKGFDPNNSIMRPYEDSLKSAYVDDIESLIDQYFAVIEDYYQNKNEYYHNILNDCVSTTTILPLLFLRRNISREMLQADMILERIDRPYDFVSDYWKIAIASEIDMLDLEGDNEEFMNLLTFSIETLYNEKRENYRILEEQPLEIKEEIEEMKAIEESNSGLIFSNGGILAFLTFLVYLFKFLYEDQSSRVIDWIQKESRFKFLVMFFILWIIIHDFLKIIYFQYRFDCQGLAWIGTMTASQSWYISTVVFFYGFFLYCIKKNRRNISRKTLLTSLFVAILSMMFLVISNEVLFFLSFFFLAMSYLMNFCFENGG